MAKIFKLFSVLFLVAGLGTALLSVAALSTAAPALAEEGAPSGDVTDFEYLIKTAGQNDERLDYHIDSWVALALIVSSFLIAFALNHQQASVRTMGSFLSALGCFALFGWFVFVFGSAAFEDPRPLFLPPDVLKPTLLTLQAAAALGAGFFLLLVTYWQSQRSEPLVLASQNTASRYGFVHRMLHWSIAILFLSLVPMGIFTSMIPEDVWYRQGYYVAHKTIGFSVLLLVLVRLLWRYRSPPPPLDDSLKTWERRMAHSVHVLLYVFLIAFPLSGFIMSTSGGKLSHFFFLDTPLFWEPNEGMLIASALVHKVILPYIFYLLIGAHVLGALKHQFLDGHPNAFRRMVS